jgi:hypothetical protein
MPSLARNEPSAEELPLLIYFFLRVVRYVAVLLKMGSRSTPTGEMIILYKNDFRVVVVVGFVSLVVRCVFIRVDSESR